MTTFTAVLTTNSKGRATVVRSLSTISDGTDEDEKDTYFIRAVFPFEFKPEDILPFDEDGVSSRFMPDGDTGNPIGAIQLIVGGVLFANPELIEVYPTEADAPDLDLSPTSKDGKILVHLICGVDIPVLRFNENGRRVSPKRAEHIVRNYSENAIETFDNWGIFTAGNTYCVVGDQQFLADDCAAVSKALMTLGKKRHGTDTVLALDSEIGL